MRSRPGLAAITLSPLGGGVAAVSRLLRQVLEEQWGGVPVRSLVPGAPGSLATTAVDRLSFGAKLAWLQASGGCDWMLCTHLSVARAQRQIPVPFRRPYAVFLHGIEAWRPLSPSQSAAIKAASVLLTNSSFTAGRIAEVHPWIPAPVVCPLTLPPEGRIESDSGQHAWGPHAVLTVGRLSAAERYKGHDQLLQAWPDVVAAVADARLVFVGGGDDSDRLRHVARETGIADSVVLTGFLDDEDIRRAYRSAAVFAMPSRNEGFGLVYLEAMSRALPCIGSIHDAARDVIADGDSGFLVDQADTRALAERVIRLLKDDSLRAAMGHRGAELLQTRFSYARFRDAVVGALSSTFEAEPQGEGSVEGAAS